MPTVPIQSTPQQVTGISQGRVRVSADESDFGGQVGEAISRLGGTAAALAERARKIAAQKDMTAAKNAFLQYNDTMRPFLHGENGIYTQRGLDADGALVRTGEEIQKVSSDTRATLINRRQEEAFDVLIGNRRQSTLDGVAKYEGRQRQVSDAETTAALLQDYFDNALNNPGDQGAIDDALAGVEIAIRTNGQGQSEDVMMSQIEAARSNIHKGVVTTLLVNDPQAARDYYNRNKDDVEGRDRSLIESALKAGILRSDSQAKTDEIMANGKNPAEQLDEARAITNPELRDETVKRVKLRLADDASALDTEKKKIISDAWVQFDGLVRAGAPLEELLKIQEVMFDHSTRAAMDKVIKNIVSGKDIVTNWQRYYSLRVMSMDEPQKFKDLNLTKFFGELATTEREGLVDIQQRINADGDTAGRTLNQLVTQSLRDIGVDTGAGGGKKDKERTAQFWRRVEAEIKEFKQVNKREATREDQIKIIDGLMIEGEIKGRTIFNDPDKFFFEVKPGEDFFIDDVPADDRAQIIEALRRAGQPITNESIVNLYTRKVTNNASN